MRETQKQYCTTARRGVGEPEPGEGVNSRRPAGRREEGSPTPWQVPPRSGPCTGPALETCPSACLLLAQRLSLPSATALIDPPPGPWEGRTGASGAAGVAGKHGGNEHPEGTSTLLDRGGGGGGRAGRVATALGVPSQRNTMAVWRKAARYCRVEMDLFTPSCTQPCQNNTQKRKCGEPGWSSQNTSLEGRKAKNTTLGPSPPTPPARHWQPGTPHQPSAFY